MTEIQTDLFALQDCKYRDFNAKLIPNIDKSSIIGVRTPELRKYAKIFMKSENAADFINTLPHKYYEENNLHGFIISQIKDFDEVIYRLDLFLPYIDNWATCDSIRPICFKRNLDGLIIKINEWLSAKHTYTVRFAIEMLMTHFLDENFQEEYLELAASVVSDEYYIKMMIAWYFATALAKQYEKTLPYILNRKLDKWTHNKTIQKAIESYRITDEQKMLLKSQKLL